MAGGGHNEEKFKSAIILLSISNEWDEAKSEWDLDFVYNDPSDRSCECEHSPIHQICVIKNTINENKTEVGNVCVRRFLRLLSNRVFSVLKRLNDNIEKSLNPKSLEIFRKKGVISEIEEQDYKGYWRKRTTITDEEKEQKIDINERVLSYFVLETNRLIKEARDFGIKKIQPQNL